MADRATRVRQGRTGKPVLLILGVSLALMAAAFIVLFAAGWFNEDASLSSQRVSPEASQPAKQTSGGTVSPQ